MGSSGFGIRAVMALSGLLYDGNFNLREKQNAMPRMGETAAMLLLLRSGALSPFVYCTLAASPDGPSTNGRKLKTSFKTCL